MLFTGMSDELLLRGLKDRSAQESLSPPHFLLASEARPSAYLLCSPLVNSSIRLTCQNMMVGRYAFYLPILLAFRVSQTFNVQHLNIPEYPRLCSKFKYFGASGSFNYRILTDPSAQYEN